MKVLLTNPPVKNRIKIVREGRCMQREDAWGTSWPPLTLATMGAVLKDSGFTIRIEDCTKAGKDIAAFKDILRTYDPGLVIFNTATPSIDNDLACASYVKEVLPQCKTAFFGIHVTALDQECMEKYPDVEFIIRGEPELTALELAKAIRENLSREDLPGITWRNNTTIIRNQDRPYIENLDRLPFPAWEDVDLDLYRMPISGEVFLLVMASRGCPYRCTFCSASTIYGKKRRHRSPARIVDEMTYLEKKFRVSSFLFWAEGFVAEKEQVYGVCDEIIARGFNFKWVANSRVDAVDIDLLTKMREAGCWMIGYGIESGSQEILNRVKKDVTLTQIEKAVSMAKQAGIKVTAHVIIGFPGETEGDIRKTENFIKNLDIDFLQLYCCVPFPGSDLYEQAQEKGWITTNNWELFEQNFSVLTTPQLSADAAMRLRRQFLKSYYLAPRKVLKTLSHARNFHDLKNLLGMAKNFIKWL